MGILVILSLALVISCPCSGSSSSRYRPAQATSRLLCCNSFSEAYPDGSMYGYNTSASDYQSLLSCSSLTFFLFISLPPSKKFYNLLTYFHYVLSVLFYTWWNRRYMKEGCLFIYFFWHNSSTLNNSNM